MCEKNIETWTRTQTHTYTQYHAAMFSHGVATRSSMPCNMICQIVKQTKHCRWLHLDDLTIHKNKHQLRRILDIFLTVDLWHLHAFNVWSRRLRNKRLFWIWKSTRRKRQQWWPAPTKPSPCTRLKPSKISKLGRAVKAKLKVNIVQRCLSISCEVAWQQCHVQLVARLWS